MERINDITVHRLPSTVHRSDPEPPAARRPSPTVTVTDRLPVDVD
jgi:hypothetical protein